MREGLVWPLLARGDVNPDTQGNGCRKPLGIASLYGDMYYVALFQSRTTTIFSMD